MTSKAVRKYVKDLDRVECGAKTSDGDPCKNPPMLGGKRCRMHGGAAPQVKAKAQERLLEGVPKMLRMLKQLASDEAIPPAVRLAAIKDWLDRAGIDRKIEVEVTSSSFEQLIAGAIATLDDDDRALANTTDYLRRIQSGEVIEGELVGSSAAEIEYSPGGQRHDGKPIST